MNHSDALQIIEAAHQAALEWAEYDKLTIEALAKELASYSRRVDGNPKSFTDWIDEIRKGISLDNIQKRESESRKQTIEALTASVGDLDVAKTLQTAIELGNIPHVTWTA